MNLTITKGYSNLRTGGFSEFKHPLSEQEKNHVGMCKNKQENNMKFSGNFTGKSEIAANYLKKPLSQRFLESRTLSKFLESVHTHNITTSALIALGFAGVLRPATILSLPGKKDKDDKIYASGHSIASALMGFGVSLILTSPLDIAMRKIETNKIQPKKLTQLNKEIEELEKQLQTDEIAKKLKSMKAYRKALVILGKNVPDWIIAIPRAALTIALIPPILKYVFGLEKNKTPKSDNTKNDNKNKKELEPPQINPELTLKSAAFKEIMEGGKK